MRAHRVHISLLSECLGFNRLALRRDAHDILADFGNLVLSAVLDQTEHVLHGLRADALAALCELHQGLDGFHRQFYVIRIRTGNLEFGFSAEHRDIQCFFQHLHIFVKRAKNSHD